MRDCFHDVVLLVGDCQREFKAHRAILCARSKFFEAMFCSNMKESQQNAVRLPQVSAEIFPDLLNYLYTDRTSTTDIVALYDVACFFQVESLINVLKIDLQRGITLANVVSMYAVAVDLQIPELKTCCENFVITHANILLKKEKYLKSLSHNVMELLLKSGKTVFYINK